jgi:sugar lactone lactonase YvrE
MVFLVLACRPEIRPPSVVAIAGPDSTVVGVPVAFSVTVGDQNSARVAAQLDWGDSSTTAWSPSIAPGDTIEVQHAFGNAGPNVIRVRTRTREGKQTGWLRGAGLTVLPPGPSHPRVVRGAIAVNVYGTVLGLTRDNRILYVNKLSQYEIVAVRVADRQVVGTLDVDVPSDGGTMTSSPAGDRMYICCPEDGCLLVVRTADDSVVRELSADGGMALSRNGELLYVTLPGRGRLEAVRADSFAVVDSWQVGWHPNEVVVNPAGNRAYVACRDGGVRVLDLRSHTIAATILTRQEPRLLSISPDGKRLYFCDGSDSAIAVASTSENQVVARVAVGDPLPRCMALTPDGAYLLATTKGGFKCIDTRTLQCVDSLGGTSNLTYFVINPAGDSVYVLMQNRVFVIGE